MAQRVQDKKPKRNKAAEAWIKENTAEQKVRYQAIDIDFNSICFFFYPFQ